MHAVCDHETAKYGPWTTTDRVDESIPNGFKASHRLIVDAVITACVADNPSSDGIILEVGAGLGALGEIIPAEYAGRYIQTDRTPLYAAKSQERNPHLTTLAADVKDLPFDDEVADMVVARDLFDMLDDPAAAAAEIWRTLKPGGHFVHFRDRRPNIGHVIHTLLDRAGVDRSVAYIFPGVSDKALTHLRLIREEDYNEARENWGPGLRELMDRYAADAEYLDNLRAQHSRQLDHVASRAAKIPGVDTPTIGELFTDQTTATLQRAGFIDVDSNVLRAEVFVGQDCLDHLFTKEYMARYRQTAYPLQNNLLVHDPNGRYEFEWHATGVPPGIIRQIGMLGVIVAQK